MFFYQEFPLSVKTVSWLSALRGVIEKADLQEPPQSFFRQVVLSQLQIGRYTEVFNSNFKTDTSQVLHHVSKIPHHILFRLHGNICTSRLVHTCVSQNVFLFFPQTKFYSHLTYHLSQINPEFQGAGTDHQTESGYTTQLPGTPRCANIH